MSPLEIKFLQPRRRCSCKNTAVTMRLRWCSHHASTPVFVTLKSSMAQTSIFMFALGLVKREGLLAKVFVNTVAFSSQMAPAPCCIVEPRFYSLQQGVVWFAKISFFFSFCSWHFKQLKTCSHCWLTVFTFSVCKLHITSHHEWYHTSPSTLNCLYVLCLILFIRFFIFLIIVIFHCWWCYCSGHINMDAVLACVLLLL